MPCALLLAVALCAVPGPATAPALVLVVAPREATGATANTGRGLANLLEEDLRLVPGWRVRTEADLADPAQKGRLPGASHLIRLSLALVGGAASVSASVIQVSDQRVLGSARTRVEGGEWNLARVELVTGIAKALSVPLPQDYAVEAATGEQLEAWGAALALVAAGDPKAKAAVEGLVKRWPDFAPAVRLLKRLG